LRVDLDSDYLRNFVYLLTNDLFLDWIKSFWKFIGKAHGVLNDNFPIVPTSKDELVSISKAANVIILPTPKEDPNGISPILKKLDCTFLQISSKHMHQDTQIAICPTINSESFLYLLTSVPVENYSRLGGNQRTQLLFHLQQFSEVHLSVPSISRYIRSLPLFEKETGERPDFLINLAAFAIWNNIENSLILMKILKMKLFLMDNLDIAQLLTKLALFLLVFLPLMLIRNF